MKKFLALILTVMFVFGLAGCNSQQLPKEIETIMSEAQVEQEQAESIFEILKSIGVDEFDKFEHDSMLDSWDYESQTGYRIDGYEFSNLILYLDGNKQVDIITYVGVDIYKENEIIFDFDELVLNSDEKVFLTTQTKLTIKEYLTVPNSADFPWFDWEYSYSTCHTLGSKLNNVNMVEISSYVDAKNVFGVKIRQNFTMVYCNFANTDTWQKVYLSIGNQVYYDFIDDYLITDGN